MEVRLLNANEIGWAVSTAVEVYTVCVLPYAQTPEEIEQFQEYVNEDHLWVELCKKKLYLWGAFEQGQMCGVSAMEHNGRVTMLYVKPAYRLGNCELELMRAMRAYAVNTLGLAEGAVQVKLLHPEYSQPGADQIPYGQSQGYGHSGYGQSQGYGQSGYGQSQGYGRAESWNTNTTERNTGRKKGTLIAVGAVIAAIMVVAITSVICVKRTFRTAVAEPEEKFWEVPDNVQSLSPEADDIWDTLWDTQIPEAEGEAETETVNGYVPLPEGLGADVIVPLEDIYIAENLEYTVSEAKIEVADDETKGVTEFEVNYPQITYGDGRDASAVNQILRDCACLWMDAMYPEPDMAAMPAYDEEYPYLASYVDYEITYMSNDLLCVAFDDHYFAGSIYLECGDLRTRVIRLSTGECYDIEDIITHDGAFDKEYYQKLCAEKEEFRAAPAFDHKNAGETLDGEISDARYYSNFAISKSGIKINLTYHYGDDDRIMRGWISTDYSVEELADYRTESGFWQLYAGE